MRNCAVKSHSRALPTFQIGYRIQLDIISHSKLDIISHSLSPLKTLHWLCVCMVAQLHTQWSKTSLSVKFSLRKHWPQQTRYEISKLLTWLWQNYAIYRRQASNTQTHLSAQKSENTTHLYIRMSPGTNTAPMASIPCLARFGAQLFFVRRFRVFT